MQLLLVKGVCFVARIRYRLIAVCLTTSCGVLVCRTSRKSAITSALLFTLLLLTAQKSVGHCNGQTLLAKNNGGGSLLLHAAQLSCPIGRSAVLLGARTQYGIVMPNSSDAQLTKNYLWRYAYLHEPHPKATIHIEHAFSFSNLTGLILCIRLTIKTLRMCKCASLRT